MLSWKIWTSTINLTSNADCLLVLSVRILLFTHAFILLAIIEKFLKNKASSTMTNPLRIPAILLQKCSCTNHDNVYFSPINCTSLHQIKSKFLKSSCGSIAQNPPRWASRCCRSLFHVCQQPPTFQQQPSTFKCFECPAYE